MLIIVAQYRISTTGKFNPYMANGLAHHYHLGESTFILGASGVVLDENFVSKQNSPHLGINCLPMPHKK